MESLSLSKTYFSATLDNFEPLTQGVAPSLHCRNPSRHGQAPSQTATPTTSELESCGGGIVDSMLYGSTKTPVDKCDSRLVPQD